MKRRMKRRLKRRMKRRLKRRTKRRMKGVWKGVCIYKNKYMINKILLYNIGQGQWMSLVRLWGGGEGRGVG